MSTLTSRTGRRTKIAASLALVAGLLYFLDIGSLGSAVTEIKVGYLLLAFAILIVNRILMPVKWNLLLRARAIQLSHFEAVRLYTISSFLGLVLPPTIGADSVRSYYIKQAGIKLSDAVASIVIERVFGLIVLLVFTVVSFFLLVDLLRDGDIQFAAFAGVLAVLSVALLAALYLSFTLRFQQLAGSLSARLQGTRLNKLALGADHFVRAYQEYRHKKGILALFCGLTALEVTLVIVRGYVVALSLGVDLSIFVYFAFLPLVSLLNRMPISFNGFGINEALFIYFLGMFGVLPEKGFLIGFINQILFIVSVLPGGIFYVLSNRSEDQSAPIA